MSWLGNIKILNKLLAVIAFMAVSIGGCIWYATSQMAAIDAGYSRFIEGEGKAVADVRRLNRFLFMVRYATARAAVETEDAPMRAAEEVYQQSLKGLKTSFEDLHARATSFSAKIDETARRFDAFLGDATKIMALGLRNENVEALAMMGKVGDRSFDEALKAGTALSDAIEAFVDTNSNLLTGTTNATRTNTAILCAAAILAGIGIAVFVILFGITRPVNGMTSSMSQLAGGDLGVAVPGIGRKDEIGAMAEAVQVFKDNMIRTKALEDETEVARKSAEEQRRQAMRDMADSFERAVGGIIGAVGSAATELQATAQTMTATATETASQSTTVAAAAEEAASNVNTVAAAAEELGSSVQEIGRQVNGSAELASQAVEEAAQTATLVQELSQAAGKIGDVVRMISDIAGQTNLLALNATIEAARAGEAGRGFAVVAAEVKELASQTAKATDEIGSQIARIQGSTDQAVGAISGIANRIQEISGVATSIAAAVEEQGAATQEIVRNVGQAATGTGEVTSNISGVARAAEETGAAASQVLSSASELSRQSEHLNGEVGKFLATVRAA